MSIAPKPRFGSVEMLRNGLECVVKAGETNLYKNGFLMMLDAYRYDMWVDEEPGIETAIARAHDAMFPRASKVSLFDYYKLILQNVEDMNVPKIQRFAQIVLDNLPEHSRKYYEFCKY